MRSKQDLYRIDDRLIHGQVVVGWGSVLRPDIIILANDEIASSDLDSELYLLGVPVEYEGIVTQINDLDKIVNEKKNCRKIIVMKSLKDALRSVEKGIELKELNIGGLHSQVGKKEINHYIYVDQEDVDNIILLQNKGIGIYIQDLPSNKRYDISYLLKKWNDLKK